MDFRKMTLILVLATLALPCKSPGEVLVPMDLTQTDHLKAYGLAYKVLKSGLSVEWLLNYRGGSFLFEEHEAFVRQARLMGVRYETVGPEKVVSIHALIEEENMEVMLLEKAPRVAVYTPPNTSPWDDAVTLALSYAEIDYETLWDEEVIRGRLLEYDWLHLHHEDFTGQYSKFYNGYQGREWLQEEVARNQEVAGRLGFDKVWKLKHAVASRIADYVRQGGFLFAMCLAAETLDIALAAGNADLVPEQADGDPIAADAQARLDFSKTLAFENFTLELNPLVNSFSDIDGHQVNNPPKRQKLGYFQLFQFSAKYDPVPTLLTQNHTDFIKGFYGQSTSFTRHNLKDAVTVLAFEQGKPWVKYIHGNAGKGAWTFLGGHDPEDPEHRIGDSPTRLELHKNSPGYRLILNNLLFPAAKKKELKT
ncbi:MAG: asparagine synthetase B [Candidatus Glassbacteria bacterium]|nr:asparagine synthetase B [Candidatus Glassbacteria bacterium]